MLARNCPILKEILTRTVIFPLFSAGIVSVHKVGIKGIINLKDCFEKLS